MLLVFISQTPNLQLHSATSHLPYHQSPALCKYMQRWHGTHNTSSAQFRRFMYRRYIWHLFVFSNNIELNILEKLLTGLLWMFGRAQAGGAAWVFTMLLCYYTWGCWGSVWVSRVTLSRGLMLQTNVADPTMAFLLHLIRLKSRWRWPSIFITMHCKTAMNFTRSVLLD